jgi:hypothetical protein
MNAELQKRASVDENGMEVQSSIRWVLFVNGLEVGEPFSNRDEAVIALNAALNTVNIPFFEGGDQLRHQLKIDEIYAQVEKYDFSKIVAYYCAKKNESLENGEVVLAGLKRWLTICAAFPEEHYTIGGHIDNMWHIFILHTNEYLRFCQKTCGFYINHIPGPINKNGTPQGATNAEIEKTASAYQCYFGSDAKFNFEDTEKYMRSGGENCSGGSCVGTGVLIGIALGIGGH